MKKIKLYLFSIIFTLLLLFCTKVEAAGTISLKASSTTVDIGDEFSISVNLSGASIATLTTRVSVDTSKVSYVSGPSNSSFSNGRVIYTWTDPTGGENPQTGGTIATFKFKAKQAGKASFSVSGDFYDSNENPVNPSFSGTSVTIEEKTVTPPSTDNSGSGGNTGGSTGGTTGGTTGGNTGNTGGSSGTTGGTTKPETGGTNTGGSSSGGSSGNTGTTTVSKNANLKELHLNVEGLIPSFNKNTTTYYITVPNTVNSINITANPEDTNAKVNISGNTNLKTGSNKITIVVTAPDNKTKKTYTINVTKTDDPQSANANLENLAIENVILNPEFNTNILEYTAEVSSDADTLNILAVPQIEQATVNIQGGTNLNFGENVITISVLAKDGVTKKDYIIQVYKRTLEEEQQQQIETMLIEEDLQQEQIQEENTNQQETGVTVGEAIFVTTICGGVLGAIIMLIEKYRKERR